jgi:hypothetical protein
MPAIYLEGYKFIASLCQLRELPCNFEKTPHNLRY